MKFIYPKHLDTNKITVILVDDELDDNGSKTVLMTLNKLARVVETSKTVRSKNGEYINVNTIFICEGNIASQIERLNGSIIFNSVEYKIVNSKRPRNPDGTVCYTEMWVV